MYVLEYICFSYNLNVNASERLMHWHGNCYNTFHSADLFKSSYCAKHSDVLNSKHVHVREDAHRFFVFSSALPPLCCVQCFELFIRFQTKLYGLSHFQLNRFPFISRRIGVDTSSLFRSVSAPSVSTVELKFLP